MHRTSLRAIAFAAAVAAVGGVTLVAAPVYAAPTPVATTWPTTTGSDPGHITAGPDGNLWFTEDGTNSIGRVTTAGVITEFPIPTPAANPKSITSGPDGNLWFTEGDTDQIGRITPTGVITEFPITVGSGPSGIVAAPDGNLWFGEGTVDKIGVMDTSGTVLHEYPATAGTEPFNIVVGSDGNLWYTEFHAAAIGTIDITTGAVTDYATTVDTRFLALGSDGNIWFSVNGLSGGGNVTPTGTVTTLGVMNDSGPVIPGPDSDLRVSDDANATIDTITTAGANTAQYGIGVLLPPSSLVTGPDNNIWFTVNDNVGVLNLNPPAAPAATVPGLPVTGIDAAPYLLIGSGLVLAGLALAWVVWFRKRRATR